jgi:sugar phosphate permease
MVLIGLLILGTGFLIFWQVRNLWMFYLAFIIMAMGQGLGSWLPMMTAINNWFVRRRATAMGWANVGSRLGALLLVPAIAWSLAPEPGRPGWQLTALILGIVILVAAVPLSRLIRNRPQDYNQLPDGDSPTLPQAQEMSSPRLASATPRRSVASQSSADLTAS